MGGIKAEEKLWLYFPIFISLIREKKDEKGTICEHLDIASSPQEHKWTTEHWISFTGVKGATSK